jgi:hypothetical protein
MARYNCTSNGPRPDSYVEDLEVCFSLCLSAVCLSVCVCLRVCLSVYVSVCMLNLNGESDVEEIEVCLSVFLSMSVFLSFYLCVCLYVGLTWGEHNNGLLQLYLERTQV